MRRSVIPAVTLSLALALAAAPQPSLAQGGLGLKGGLSYSNVSNSGVLPGDLQSRTGYTVGLSVGTRGGLVGFGADLLYAQRGVESDGGQDFSDRRIDYIDVPVYLRVGVPLGGVRPFAHIGPQVSLELRCQTGSEGSVSCPPSDRPTTTFAGVLGAGLGFSLGVGPALTLEGRYIYGITDLEFSDLSEFEPSSESFQDRSFVLMVGVSF